MILSLPWEVDSLTSHIISVINVSTSTPNPFRRPLPRYGVPTLSTLSEDKDPDVPGPFLRQSSGVSLDTPRVGTVPGTGIPLPVSVDSGCPVLDPQLPIYGTEVKGGTEGDTLNPHGDTLNPPRQVYPVGGSVRVLFHLCHPHLDPPYVPTRRIR